MLREILCNKYESIAGIECKDFRNESNQKSLKEINEFIATYYDEIRRELNRYTNNKDIDGHTRLCSRI